MRCDPQRHERHGRAAQAGRVCGLPVRRPVVDGQEGQSEEDQHSLTSLSGKSVSVEVGTTNKQFLDAESKLLTKKGKPAIKVVTFPKDTDAASALKTGRVDAYFGDSPVVAYYLKRDPSFGFAGRPVNPIPVGMAIRKGDALIPKVRKAVTSMYADGTMKKILAKWQMGAFALKR